LTGDAYQNCSTTPCTVEAYRLNFNASNDTSTATSLTNEGTAANNFADANTAHADSRAIAFDASGDLILGSDGGIYLRTNPQGNGTWSGLNNNLTVLEPYVHNGLQSDGRRSQRRLGRPRRLGDVRRDQ